jgi:ketosteroid isomerase-like protein
VLTIVSRHVVAGTTVVVLSNQDRGLWAAVNRSRRSSGSPTHATSPRHRAELPRVGCSVPEGKASMSAEQNAALVRRYFTECVDRASGPDQNRALALLDELLADDFVMTYNNQSDSEAMRGRQDHRDFLVRHASYYPNDHWTVEALIADEESAACQWRIQATYAPTGNPIDVRGADFYQIRDGRLAELRRFLDFKSLDRQGRRPRTRR